MESVRSYKIRESPWTFIVYLEYINVDESEFGKKGFNAEKIYNKPHGGVSKGFNGEILNENSMVVAKVQVGRKYDGYKWLADRGVFFKVVEHLPNNIHVEHEVSFIPKQEISLAYKTLETLSRVVYFSRTLEDPGGRDAPPPSIHITRSLYVQKKGFLGSERKLTEVKNIVIILDVTSEQLQQGQETQITASLKNIHRVYCNELMCEHRVCDPYQDDEATCSLVKEVNIQKLRDSSYISRVYLQGVSIDKYFEDVKISEVIKSPSYESIKPIRNFLDSLKESIQDADLLNSIDKIWMGIHLAKNYYVQLNRLTP